MDNRIDRLEELKQNILKLYRTDAASVVDMCHEVERLSTELQDSYSFAFGEYYLGASYYFLNRTEEMLILFETAIPSFHTSGYFLLEARAYNLLGVSFSAKQDLLTALDYFLQALETASKYEFFEQCAMISNNISLLFSCVHDHRSAVEFLRQAVDYGNKVSDDSFVHSKLVFSFNLCQTLMNLGRYEEALSTLEGISQYKRIIEKNISLTCFRNYNYMRLSAYFGNDKLYKEYLPKTIKALCSQNSVVTQMSLFLETCEFLLGAKEYEYLNILIADVEKKAKKINMTTSLSELCNLKILYYKAIGADKDVLDKAYEEYFKNSFDSHSDKQLTLAKAANMFLSLGHIEREQAQLEEQKKMLVHRSEYDALTKLPNRAKLKTSLEFRISEARKNHVKLGVMLMDVDCFKQYNDTFGHPLGDRVLRGIGSVLRHHTSDDIEFFRYGGDEFIGILYNKTDEEIDSLIESIEKDIFDLGIKSVCPERSANVSATCGYTNIIPDEGTKYNILINNADTNLYSKKAAWKLAPKA